MEMNWTCVLDALPEIPKDKFAVSVMVILYDPQEAECFNYSHPLSGVSVFYGSYGYVRHIRHPMNLGLKMGFHKEGDPISEWFKDWPKEIDFISSMEGPKGHEWAPFFDPITHWMYWPSAPKDYDYRKYFGYPEKSE